MAYLLSSTNLFFKRFISPNFFGPQNLKLTHVDKKRQNEMFSEYFSIHKRKGFNEHYILTLTEKKFKQQ